MGKLATEGGARIAMTALAGILLATATRARTADASAASATDAPQIVQAAADTPADVSAATEISLAPGNWNYRSSAPSAVASPEIDFTIPAEVTPLGFYHPAERRVLFSADPEVGIAVATEFHSSGSAGESSLLLKIDLKGQRLAGTWVDPSHSHVVDLTRDGTRALLLGDSQQRHGQDRIQIVDMTAQPPKVLVASVPYAMEDQGKRKINMTMLIDDEHVLTQDNDNRVVLWKVPEMTPVYSHHVVSHIGAEMAVSPDRRYLVTEEDDPKSFRFSSQIVLLDALTGQPRGTIPYYVPADAWHAYLVSNKISPDGKFLLHEHANGMALFALESEGPRKVLDMGKPMGVQDQSIGGVVFARPGYLLINDQYLFDIDKQFIVWRYERLDKERYVQTGEDRFIACGRTRINPPRDPNANPHPHPGTGPRPQAATEIRSFELPGPAERQRLASLNPATLYVIRAGDKVSVEVRLSDNAETNQKIADAFKKQLEQNGMVVADNQPIKLEVSRGSLGMREVEYRGITNPSLHATAHVAASQIQVAFTINGKVVWENSRINGGAPPMVKLNAGQSIDQAVAEKQVQTPVVDFILPKQVPAPRDPVGFGVTDLTYLMNPQRPKPSR